MTLAVAFIAVAANAQVYLGGSVGVATSEVKGGDDVTTYQVLPEIGYKINRDWAIGVVLGWSKGAPVEIEEVKARPNKVMFEPYVRYTFAHSKYVNAFIDGGFGYTHFNHAKNPGGKSVDVWSAGLKPGVSVNLSKKVSFVAHMGFFGWKSKKIDGDDKDAHVWGVNLNASNINFGVYYNF